VVLLILASILTFTLTSLTFSPLDSLLERKPATTPGRHRRQGRRTSTSTSPSRSATPTGWPARWRRFGKPTVTDNR
jgi:hypothetical protein